MNADAFLSDVLGEPAALAAMLDAHAASPPDVPLPSTPATARCCSAARGRDDALACGR